MPPDQATRSDDDGADEAWIRTASSDLSIRVRNLTRYLEQGGHLVSARLVEGSDGLFRLWVRMGDRPGEFLLNQFHQDETKTFKDLGLAVATIRREMGFYGEIVLGTEKRGGPVRRRRGGEPSTPS